ncbi:MAG: YebC/PmpR family DNA-binding transcriptional regulator [Gammaproteobacteria bacterium]|nr:YebC/PmpR family DNA-binding transcriptional regulator [Gammaproteobacteria bacterium]
MAGHSKWANIQHRKNAQDAKRGKIFTKLIRELTVAARIGGGDPASNPRLRAAIDKALSNNMTRDTVERAIKRGAGENDGNNVEELYYEGYAPGGVAVLVECMTDNRKRTAPEVRSAFGKGGGNMGVEGSVNFLFKQQGIISFAPGSSEDKIIEIALNTGAEDVMMHDDGSIDVITTLVSFGKIKDALDKAGLEAVNAEVSMEAGVKVEISNAEEAEAIKGLIERLEELDDVQNVYTNADILIGN